MAYPADFRAAHRRHWQDAELLFKHQRWANADQLYGLSAECGLKAVMVGLGMEVGPQGAPPQRYRKHVNDLWPQFVTFVSGRSGSPYMPMLPPVNPFATWSIDSRYAHGRYFSKAAVDPHREAALATRKMAQRAQQENHRSRGGKPR